MPLVFRPARADELQRAQELTVRSISDLTERHGFGPLATLRTPDFQLFSLQDDPDGLWVGAVYSIVMESDPSKTRQPGSREIHVFPLLRFAIFTPSAARYMSLPSQIIVKSSGSGIFGRGTSLPLPRSADGCDLTLRVINKNSRN
jgi:hypothetical protein